MTAVCFPTPFTRGLLVQRITLISSRKPPPSLPTHQNNKLTPHRDMVSYSMTKVSALAFHEGLAAELRGKQLNAPEIKLTCVHPTFASTDMIADVRAQIEASGMAVIEPHVVADAVVKQVLSGRGNQLLLAPGIEFLNTMRSWPTWLTVAVNVLTGL
jgi:short-subunit dehydrogenase